MEVLYTEKEIATCIENMASPLNRMYSRKIVTVVVIMNGAFMFAADLMRKFTFEVDLKFVKASSYGDGMESSGVIEMSRFGRDWRYPVLILDDIFETGMTIHKVADKIREVNNGINITTCTLFYKEGCSYLTPPLKPDYFGIIVPKDKFIYGYGMDLQSRERNLPVVKYMKRPY